MLTNTHKTCIVALTRNVSDKKEVILMNMMDAKKIGERLVQLRGSNSIVKTANDLNISPSALSMYENGERIPRDNIKIRIAAYYNKPIQDIFFAE